MFQEGVFKWLLLASFSLLEIGGEAPAAFICLERASNSFENPASKRRRFIRRGKGVFRAIGTHGHHVNAHFLSSLQEEARKHLYAV